MAVFHKPYLKIKSKMTHIKLLQIAIFVPVISGCTVDFDPGEERLRDAGTDADSDTEFESGTDVDTDTDADADTDTDTDADTDTDVDTCSDGSCEDGIGLTGTYFDNDDFTNPVLERVDSTINFNWGDESPDPLLDVDTFSVRWVGTVEALYSDTFTFYTTVDDGARLWVDGVQLIDNWTNQTQTTDTGTAILEAGWYHDIKLEYYNGTGAATMILEWSSVNQTKQVIPRARLNP